MKASRGEPPLENRLLRARARGEISTDAAFEALFREYAKTVAAWLSVRVEPAAVEDLAQDVWLIFYGRFRRWEFGTEMESTEARPVLSFLFRTCRYVARGYRRLAQSRRHDPLPEEKTALPDGRTELSRELEAKRILAVAGRVCPEDEVDVLLAKLAGLSGKETAKLLSLSPAVVDHRYRDALARIRKAMKIEVRRKKKLDG